MVLKESKKNSSLWAVAEATTTKKASSTSLSSPTYSLDPNNPKSLGYYDGLRLLASRAVGETTSPSREDNIGEHEQVGRLGYHVDSTWTTLPREISATIIDWAQEGGQGSPQDDNRHQASLVTVGTVQPDGTRSNPVHLGHLTAMVPLGLNSLFVLDWAVASLLAIHHWNNQISNVLPILASPEVRECRVRFTHEYLDTLRNPREASRLLVRDVLPRELHDISKPRPTALLGAIRSPVTMNLATLGGLEGLPLFSHGSASTSLSNPDEYPLFGRLTPSSAGTAQAAASYFRFLGATHVGVIYLRDSWGDSYRNAFSNAVSELAAENGDEKPIVIHSVASHTNCHEMSCMESAVQKLASRGYRYFFAITGPPTFNALMELSHKYGIAGPGRFWLLSEVFSDTTIRKMKFPQGSPLAQVTHGVGRIHAGASPKVKGSPEAMNFVRAWQTLNEPEFKEYFKKQEPRLAKKMSLYRVDSYDFHSVPALYAEGLYDAVVAIGLATCQLTKKRGGANFTSEELFEQVKRTTFHGVSGHVELDPHTGSRKYESIVYTVSNVVARAADSTGEVTFDVKETFAFQPVNEAGERIRREWALIEGSDRFNYCDLSSTPPLSLPPPDLHIIGIHTSVLVAGWTLCGFLLASSVLCALWAAYHRIVPVIRASQPLFLYLICAGTFVMGCSILPLSAQPTHVARSLLDGACMLTWWLYSVGYILVFSALFAKTLRLNMILTGEGYKRVKVTAGDVCTPLVGLMSLNVAVLTAWNIFAPLQYTYVEGTKTDIYGRTLDLYGQCRYETDSKLFAGTLLAINATVSLIAFLEAFKGRNIVSDFAESKYIFCVLASILEAFAVGAPVVVVSWESPSAAFAITSALIFVTGMSTLTLLFVPKVSVVWKTQGRPISKRASSMMLGPLMQPSNDIGRGNGRSRNGVHANLKRAKKKGNRHSEARTYGTDNSTSLADQGIQNTFLHGGMDSFVDSVEKGRPGEHSESATRATEHLISTLTTPENASQSNDDTFQTDVTDSVRVRPSLFSSLFLRGNRVPVTRHSISVFRQADIQELYDSTVTTPFEDESPDKTRELFDSSTITVPNNRTTYARNLDGDSRRRFRSDSLIVSLKVSEQASEIEMSPSGLPCFVGDTVSTCHHRHSLSVFQQDEIRTMHEDSRKPLPALV